MTTFAVTSINSLFCHASTCFRIGSKFRCIRSTPTEMQSMSENDFECLASTGVNTPGTTLPDSDPLSSRFPSRLIARLDRHLGVWSAKPYLEATSCLLVIRRLSEIPFGSSRTRVRLAAVRNCQETAGNFGDCEVEIVSESSSIAESDGIER